MSAEQGGGSRSADRRLSELRRLILGPRDETARIEAIEERLDTARIFAGEVSRVLPEAVLLRARSDKTLKAALREPIEEALQESVRKNPQPIVDAIFPAIGPAIRKAIASALRQLTQRFELALQQSFSPRAVLWRIEGWRTGRPFAEVVLLKTLVYRIEQVLLIHAETGLLLQQVVAGEVEAKDPDLVSAMLTAIQDFVRDSFDAGEQETLGAMQVGDFSVWIERGRHSVVAAVIRGTAPESVREVLARAVENVEREMGQDLLSFQGDSSRFGLIRPYLEACLVSQKVRRRFGEFSRLALFFAALFCVLFFGWTGLRWWGRDRERDEFLAELRNRPGIVVTHAEVRDGVWHVYGLKDPLAADPAGLLDEEARRTFAGHWQDYIALHPRFVLARAATALRPPEGIVLDLAAGRVVARGRATHAWLRQAAVVWRGVPGVSGIDLAGVEDLDRTAFLGAKAALEKRLLPKPGAVDFEVEVVALGQELSRLRNHSQNAEIRFYLIVPEEILEPLRKAGGVTKDQLIGDAGATRIRVVVTGGD